MKRFLVLLLAVLTVFMLFVSCDGKKAAETESKTETDTESVSKSDAIYGTYIRENDNGYDSFSITLHEDGTYTYYETMISSHLGHGGYTIEDNLITLIDTQIPTYSGSATYEFKFEYRDGKLIYLAGKSDQFMYVHLPDGAEFEHFEIDVETKKPE